MATTRNEFVELADELFEEFADFISKGVFETIKRTNFESGKINENVHDCDSKQKADGIQIAFNLKIFNNSLQMAGDYIQVYRRKSFKELPEIGRTKVTFKKVKSEIIDMKIDPADAVVFLHLRRM